MKMKDPLSSAIDVAVKEAVAEHFAPLLFELKKIRNSEVTPAKPVGERFVSMTELGERLGVNRTTILRRERMGRIPKRRTFPDGRAGRTSTDIDQWFAAAEHGEPDVEKNAKLAARISH